ncbi:hypothetical protein DIZ81_03630 [Legionella taurinensis]|uniref:Uncharacterized protein n=1 Tax=Legionella taurinensis TaxID=70611 RepID=A0A3A5L158_9GAMM|nr:hypothetical protein [Legionella taurinensis]MDX1836755.1 hypothetical protein [Legionella taurinensis]PUT41178.1 hypothetical protein DB744_03630 [Legionella taurinensis]PUT42303.1 hypothetical protein DB746_07560 [Legionella taurinensis]PUT43828.1 hypothetical protein DB743_09510 [Legionella taurinensis]PUT47084.1 hypothetical protein DB745_08640 [Legionella taurinensis]
MDEQFDNLISMASPLDPDSPLPTDPVNPGPDVPDEPEYPVPVIHDDDDNTVTPDDLGTDDSDGG